MANKQSGEGNSCSNMPQPMFYKIIMSPHECTRLSIPVDFASRYCENIQNPVYLEVPDGEIWEVEVVHSESQIWLAKGWQDFSDYYSISCGHFLMFGYNGCSRFNVTIFDVSASEIEFPYNAAHDTRLAQESDQIEFHDFIEISDGARRRQEEEADDDVSIEINTKSIMVEEPQENEASPSSARKTKKSRGSCWAKKQQSKIVSAKSEMIMEKESAIAYQRAKSFTSDNPFFICSMRPSYVSGASLTIPKAIASKLFPARHNYLVVQVPNKRSWDLKCTVGPKNAKVVSGWKKFVLDNSIKVGDVCVFEQVTRSELSFNVIIFPAAEGV